MAGEPSLFLVYKDFTTDERNSDSWYGTQAAADDAATDGGADFSAHQGAVKVPEGWVTGWIYNPVDDKWRELGVFDLDTLGQRKVAAMQLHDALLAWEAGVEAVAYEKPPTDVMTAMTFLAFGHWANYVVFMNANDTWTAAQQIAWAGAMAMGAKDITTVQEFFEKAHTITAEETPEEACAWASPVNASRENLNQARIKSTYSDDEPTWFDGEETDLTMIELGNGAWIEEIT